MRLLLDTHTALWWLTNDARLSHPSRDALRKAQNEANISAVTFWELAIKTSIGKLDLPSNWVQRLSNRMNEDTVGYLHIGPAHCKAIETLPLHHKDPFDRMLAAQSQFEALTLLSRDVIFDRYKVDRLW